MRPKILCDSPSLSQNYCTLVLLHHHAAPSCFWLCDGGARWSDRLLFLSPPLFCSSVVSTLPYDCLDRKQTITNYDTSKFAIFSVSSCGGTSGEVLLAWPCVDVLNFQSTCSLGTFEHFASAESPQRPTSDYPRIHMNSRARLLAPRRDRVHFTWSWVTKVVVHVVSHPL